MFSKPDYIESLKNLPVAYGSHAQICSFLLQIASKRITTDMIINILGEILGY